MTTRAKFIYVQIPPTQLHPLGELYAYQEGADRLHSEHAKRLTKKEYLAAKVAEAREFLLRDIRPRDTVLAIPVNKACTQYRLFIAATSSDRPRPFPFEITGWYQQLVNPRATGCYPDAISMPGYGYSKSFQLIYNLGSVLWPDGTPEPHGTRNGVPDSNGGYALAR
jgi:hypothetical protein